MANQNNGEFNADSEYMVGQEIVGGNIPGYEAIIADFRDELECSEPQRRHRAYREVSKQASRLVEPFGQAFHSMYVPFDGQTGERRLFLARANFPGHGNLLRVILNDEYGNVENDNRTLHIQDYVVSMHRKAHTFQESVLVRNRAANSWSIQSRTAPILYTRATSLQVSSGDAYDVRIPKTLGYPLGLGELIVGRMRLEQLAQDLQQLDSNTYMPGMNSESGFMS